MKGSKSLITGSWLAVLLTLGLAERVAATGGGLCANISNPCACIGDFNERKRCEASEACKDFIGPEQQRCEAIFLGEVIDQPPIPVDEGGLIDSGSGQPPPAPTQPPSPQLFQGLCIPGYVQIRELCINVKPRDATSFPFSHETCRLEQITGRVATYTDYLLVARNVADVSLFNPNGLWLGPDLVGDDQALVGNKDIDHPGDPDVSDFEGVGNKNENRGFRCAYDLIPVTVLPITQ